jgi:hypothetical protein
VPVFGVPLVLPLRQLERLEPTLEEKMAPEQFVQMMELCWQGR